MNLIREQRYLLAKRMEVLSAKRILEKYTEQRSTLPAAIDATFKNVTKNTAKPRVTMWQDKEFPFTMMRIEVE